MAMLAALDSCSNSGGEACTERAIDTKNPGKEPMLFCPGRCTQESRYGLRVAKNRRLEVCAESAGLEDHYNVLPCHALCNIYTFSAATLYAVQPPNG